MGARQALAAVLCAALFVGALAGAATARTTAKTPPDVKLLINGKRYKSGPLPDGLDLYQPIKSGKLTVVSKSARSLTGTGYQIELATSEPTEHVFEVCKRGTSCRVSKTIRIRNGMEMSWKVTIYSKTGFPVGGFVVCLVGRKA
jgi:hypothetical protein